MGKEPPAPADPDWECTGAPHGQGLNPLSDPGLSCSFCLPCLLSQAPGGVSSDLLMSNIFTSLIFFFQYWELNLQSTVRKMELMRLPHLDVLETMTKVSYVGQKQQCTQILI